MSVTKSPMPSLMESVNRLTNAMRKARELEIQKLLDDVEHHAFIATMAKNEASALRAKLADAERQIASLKRRLGEP